MFWRYITLPTIALAVTFFSIELFSLLALSILEAPSFTPSSKKNIILSSLSDQTKTNPILGQPSVAHPYIGYVHNPNVQSALSSQGGFGLNSYGFIDKEDPIQKRDKDKFIVGFLGGSVAWWISYEGFPAFKKELEKSPKLKGKEIIPVRLALGGFKQPQQLFSYLYHSSLGAEFDMIINIDGFNEVTLPTIGNIGRGVSPFYPIYWGELNQDQQNTKQVKQAGKIALLEKIKSGIAHRMLKFKVYYSNSGSLVWRLFDKYLAQSISNEKVNSQTDISSKSYLLSGPKNYNDKNLHQELVNIWMRSSLHISALSKSSNTTYLHFIQPNLHDKDSKILSDKEKSLVDNPALLWEKNVSVGYPLLRKAGKKLKESGINFYDLTKIFSSDSKTLYIDDCCHLNNEGNAKIGKRIGQIAKEVLLIN